jgi:hypothetical protein
MSEKPPTSLSRSWSQRASELDTREVAFTLLGVSTAIIAWAALGYFAPAVIGDPALGDDASSHVTTIATMAERMTTGQGWWSTDYNLGFPLALYYQPLPHIVAGALCALLGGADQALLTYRLLAAAMILLQPWAIAFGLRRAGADRLTAALAGALAPILLNPDMADFAALHDLKRNMSTAFGYSVKASLNVGLFTQNWGNVALPLALGELIALVDRRGRIWAAALAAAALAACHMFYAIALVPVLGLFALLMPNRLANLSRLTAAGVVAFALLAPWQVALALNQAFFGGWPNSSGERLHGYGWRATWEMLTSGLLLDGMHNKEPYLPLVSTFFVVGALVLGARWARSAFSRSMLVLLAVAFFGTVGRAPLTGSTAGVDLDTCGYSLDCLLAGTWIDLYPLHKSVQLFRYLSLLQFVLLVVAAAGIAAAAHAASIVAEGRARPQPGTGSAWQARLREMLTGGESPAAAGRSDDARAASAQSLATSMAGLALVAVVAGVMIDRGKGQLLGGFVTLSRAQALDRPSYNELVGWLREAPTGGRLLVGPKTGARGHYHGGLLAWMGRRPAGLSYGVGLHDSLGFHYMMHYDPTKANALALADLYDFRFMVSDTTTSFPAFDKPKTKREILHQNDRYVYSRLPVSGQAVTIMREARRIESTPRESRFETRRWLNGNGPEVGSTVVVNITDPRSRAELTTAPGEVTAAEQFSDKAPPRGRVLESSAVTDTVRAKVQLDEAALIVAKVGYHPFWRATLDGKPVDTLYVFPGYFAVEAGPGLHEFDAHFSWPVLTGWLLAFAPLPLLVAFFTEPPNRPAGPTPPGPTGAGAAADGRGRRPDDDDGTGSDDALPTTAAPPAA